MAYELTREDFVSMARRLGLDVSDEAHMDELYHHVRGVKGLMAGLFDIGTEKAEPSNVFSPVRE